MQLSVFTTVRCSTGTVGAANTPYKGMPKHVPGLPERARRSARKAARSTRPAQVKWITKRRQVCQCVCAQRQPSAEPKGYDHKTSIRTSFDQRYNRYSQLSPSIRAPTRKNIIQRADHLTAATASLPVAGQRVRSLRLEHLVGLLQRPKNDAVQVTRGPHLRMSAAAPTSARSRQCLQDALRAWALSGRTARLRPRSEAPEPSWPAPARQRRCSRRRQWR